RDEGKLMGLAALGEERRAKSPWPERLSKILRVTRDGYEVDPTFTKFGGHYFADRFTDALVKLVTGFDPTLEPVAYGEKIQQGGAAVSKYLDPRYVDLAWGVQEKLEEAAKAMVTRAVKEYGIRNLCIAGGVGLNCKVNGQVKYRESWRPFCPSLVDGAKDEYLEGAAEAPFMIVAFPVKPDKRSLIPSAVHVDGTVRPQTVTEHANPRFHELLSEVGR